MTTIKLEMCAYLNDWLGAEDRNQGLANDPEIENSPEDN